MLLICWVYEYDSGSERADWSYDTTPQEIQGKQKRNALNKQFVCSILGKLCR